MRRLPIVVLVALLLVVLALLMAALTNGKPRPNYSVTMGFVENSESSHGKIATLRVENHGATTVRMDPYCTLYWTNRSEMPTNTFFRHDQGYAILSPGESTIIRVPHPHDAKVWNSSFTYQVWPGAMARLFDRIAFWLPGKWTPDNSFIGSLGPTITNPTPLVGSER